MATRALPVWYEEQVQNGMTDVELEAALKKVLGIFGGSCGPGRMDVAHQGAGLRIWGGWHYVNHHTEKPLYKGSQTVAMARIVYSIEDPEEDQMALF